jgi:signal transduction histidine kinase
MLKKIKNFKVRRKRHLTLLAVASFLLFILIIYFIIHQYYLTIDENKQTVLHRLKGITCTGALSIDGDLHQELASLPKKDTIHYNEQDARYFKIHQQLKAIKNINMLSSDIYTIIYDEAKNEFNFIVSSADYPYFKHTYKQFPRQLLTQFQTGGILDIYEDENGIWMSAFAPIKNKKGEVVALLEADEKVETFLVKAKSELIKNLVITLSISLPLIILIISFLFFQLKKENEIQVALEEQNEVIQSANEEIKSQAELLEKYNQDLESLVNERTIELKSSNQQLADFIYHSSHDVQAPLATLKGIIGIGKIQLKETFAQELMNMAENTISHMTTMLKSLQNIHTIKTKPLESENIRLKELINSIFLNLLLGKNEASCTFINDDNINISTDLTILESALTPIIRNSLQYAIDEKVLIQVSCTNRGEKVEITLQDNGPGISKEKIKTIFDLFNRNHENSKGMGVGLFTANAAATRLGGKLDFVETESGTCFRLTLPKYA